MMNWKEFRAAFGVDLLAQLVGETAREVLKAGAEAFKKDMEKRTEKSLAENRVELLNWLERELFPRDKVAYQNLFDRQQARMNCYPPYKPGDENTMVSVLLEIWTSLQEPDEANDRLELFVDLGRMSEPKFNSRIEFLRNDRFVQLARKAALEGKALGLAALKYLYKAGSRIDEEAEKLTPHVDKLTDWLWDTSLSKSPQPVGLVEKVRSLLELFKQPRRADQLRRLMGK